MPRRLLVNRDALCAALRSKRTLVVAYCLISIPYLILCLHLPTAVLTGAVGDDVIYWTQAQEILQGNWLGPYGELTLAKGSGFSLFLAVNYLSGFPVTLSIGLLYAGAVLAITTSFRHLGVGVWSRWMLFGAVLWLPAMAPTRIVRDAVYPSLLLLALGGLLSALLSHERLGRRWLPALAGGISLGLLWITREEGPWILPGIFFLVGGLLLIWRHQGQAQKQSVAVVGIWITGAAITVGVIALMNLNFYRALITTDTTTGAYTRMLSVMSSVGSERESSLIPVPRSVREEIYRVSPSSRDMRPRLEDSNNGMLQAGCLTYPELCGDYVGGWWNWAVRDAAATAGYFSTPADAQRFFNQVTEEISQACRTGALECVPAPPPFLPRLGDDATAKLPSAVGRSLLVLAGQNQAVSPDPSGPYDSNLARTKAFLGLARTSQPEASNPDTRNILMTGPPGTRLSITCPQDGDALLREVTLTSPNQGQVSNTFLALPLESQTTCLVQLQEPGLLPEVVSLTTDDFPRTTNVGSSTQITVLANPMTFESNQWPISVLGHLQQIYRYLLPAIIITGILSFGVGLMRSVGVRISSPESSVIAGSLWVLVFSRIALVSLIDVSSFPAVKIQYLLPVLPITILASGISLWSLASFLVRKRETTRELALGLDR